MSSGKEHKRHHHRHRRGWLGSGWSLAFLLLILVAGALAMNSELVMKNFRKDATPGVERPSLPKTERQKYLATKQLVIDRDPVRITLDTGAELRLPPDDKISEAVLYSGRGKFEVRPLRENEAFAVQTFNAVVGVRGTVFVVDVIASSLTSVEVSEGTVSFATLAGEEIFLTAGERGRISGRTGPVKGFGDSTAASAALDTRELASMLSASSYSSTARDGLYLEGERGERDRSYLYSAATMQDLKKRAREYLQGLADSPPESPAGMIDDDDPSTLQGMDLPTFTGNGSWASVYGFQGPVDLAIDVKKGTFSGKFTGAGRRGAVDGNIAGTFSGSYRGDKESGSLEGVIIFGASNREMGKEVPNMTGKVKGRLENKTVHGVFEGAQIDGEFSVLVKLN